MNDGSSSIHVIKLIRSKGAHSHTDRFCSYHMTPQALYSLSIEPLCHLCWETWTRRPPAVYRQPPSTEDIMYTPSFHPSCLLSLAHAQVSILLSSAVPCRITDEIKYRARRYCKKLAHIYSGKKTTIQIWEGCLTNILNHHHTLLDLIFRDDNRLHIKTIPFINYTFFLSLGVPTFLCFH